MAPNLTNIVEMVLITALLIIGVGFLADSLNNTYHKNLQVPVFDNTSSFNLTTNKIINSKSNIDNASVIDSAGGLAIPQMYGIVKGVWDITWLFFSGQFIRNLAMNMQLGETMMLFAGVLQILWFLTLIGLIIYTFFKVRSV